MINWQIKKWLRRDGDSWVSEESVTVKIRRERRIIMMWNCQTLVIIMTIFMLILKFIIFYKTVHDSTFVPRSTPPLNKWKLFMNCLWIEFNQRKSDLTCVCLDKYISTVTSVARIFVCSANTAENKIRLTLNTISSVMGCACLLSSFFQVKIFVQSNCCCCHVLMMKVW